MSGSMPARATASMKTAMSAIVQPARRSRPPSSRAALWPPVPCRCGQWRPSSAAAARRRALVRRSVPGIAGGSGSLPLDQSMASPLSMRSTGGNTVCAAGRAADAQLEQLGFLLVWFARVVEFDDGFVDRGIVGQVADGRANGCRGLTAGRTARASPAAGKARRRHASGQSRSISARPFDDGPEHDADIEVGDRGNTAAPSAAPMMRFGQSVSTGILLRGLIGVGFQPSGCRQARHRVASCRDPVDQSGEHGELLFRQDDRAPAGGAVFHAGEEFVGPAVALDVLAYRLDERQQITGGDFVTAVGTFPQLRASGARCGAGGGGCGASARAAARSCQSAPLAFSIRSTARCRCQPLAVRVAAHHEQQRLQPGADGMRRAAWFSATQG